MSHLFGTCSGLPVCLTLRRDFSAALFSPGYPCSTQISICQLQPHTLAAPKAQFLGSREWSGSHIQEPRAHHTDSPQVGRGWSRCVLGRYSKAAGEPLRDTVLLRCRLPPYKNVLTCRILYAFQVVHSAVENKTIGSEFTTGLDIY